MSATLILINGRFYTMDPRLPLARAVAIREGQILAVGDIRAIKELGDGHTLTVDLDGRSVTPGLVDAHVHFQGFSLARRRVDLDGAASLHEALERISRYLPSMEHGAPASARASWLQGRGWAQDTWQNPAFPTAADLDRIVPHRPVYLRHKSGHAAWVNTQGLKIAGIVATTADPPGGQIQRDAAGKPTGILFEDAMGLVDAVIPAATAAEVSSAMLDAQDYCWQVGLTGIHDFDGRTCFQALQLLREEGQLGLRVLKNIPLARMEHAIGVGLRSGFGDEWLRIGGVKIFADGALGPRTAAMVEPYENEPENYGIVVMDKEEMMAAASRAAAHGLSVTVHAIGDRANHDVLDVYTAVRDKERTKPLRKPLRHRIEHVQLLHPSDLQRLAELGIIASMQPIHATSDMIIASRYWGARTQYSYAWRTMLASGAALVFGSDAPVEPIDPLPGIYAAVTRRAASGAPGPEGWHPEQKLSLQEALHAFTQAAAFTSGQEDRFGSITAGKAADLTVFDQDLFALSPDELLQATVAGTIVNGRFRYRTF